MDTARLFEAHHKSIPADLKNAQCGYAQSWPVDRIRAKIRKSSKINTKNDFICRVPSNSVCKCNPQICPCHVTSSVFRPHGPYPPHEVTISNRKSEIELTHWDCPPGHDRLLLWAPGGTLPGTSVAPLSWLSPETDELWALRGPLANL